jgi:GTP-binding protein
VIPPVRSVRHVASVADPRRSPILGVPEFAFAGRSNVGKSSLLNALCGRRRLARISSTPGRTRLVELYLVNDALAFADLPGYGWAAVSKSERAGWKRLVEGYLLTRRALRGAIAILDVRRDPEDEERDLLAWFQARAIPAIAVATKCDKLGKAALFRRLQDLGRAFGAGRPPLIAFSARTGAGREALWEALLALLERGEREALAEAG